MLRIKKADNSAQADYSAHWLKREARYLAKYAATSDGKLRGWRIEVVEGSGGVGTVRLCVDFLTPAGEPGTAAAIL